MKKEWIIIATLLISFTIWPVNAIARFCLTERTDTDPDKITFHMSVLGIKQHVWINTENTPAYDCFNNPQEIKNRLAMRSRYQVVMHNYRIPHNGKHWSLLVKGNADKITKETIVGWVCHDNLITSSLPIPNEYNNIYLKALIKETSTSDAQSVSVYAHPDLKKKIYRITDEGKTAGIPVRTVFYVYDYYPKTAKSPLDPETKSVFIGADTNLDLGDTEALLLIGWVSIDKISFWDTRTACEIKYGEEAVLRNAPDKNSNIITKIRGTRLEFDELRDPILKEEGNYYYIGTFSRLKKEQLTLKRDIANIRTGLEVLFIIDGTRSMSDEFKATLSAVDEIAEELKTKSKEKGMEIPRFALLFYRDKPTKTIALQKKNGKDISAYESYCRDEYTLYVMGSIERFKSYLHSHIACDADNTIEESMYTAIIEGLPQCRFSTGVDGLPKRTRFIIHFGDAGDNGNKYSAEKVSEMIKKYSIYKYYAINVSPGSTDFSTALEDITEKIKNLDELSAFIQELKDLLTSAQEISAKVNDQIKIISRGFAGTNEGKIGVISSEVLNYAKKIIRANNIDLNKLDILQVYTEGWVEKDKVKETLLVIRTDIENIVKFLNDMTTDYGDPNKRREAWEGTLEMFLGGQNCMDKGISITLEECSKLYNGIPIHAGFMRYKLKELYNLGGSQISDVICEAKMAREQFRAFQENKFIKNFKFDKKQNCQLQPEYEFDINGDGKIVYDTPYNRNIKHSMIDKYFFKEAKASMAWIPVEHLDVKSEK